MENNCVFKLTDVTYDYMDNVHAVESINLNIHQGETISILGANGSGKSTLLKILDGLYAPSKGEFEAFGSVITEATLRDKKKADVPAILRQCSRPHLSKSTFSAKPAAMPQDALETSAFFFRTFRFF